MFSWKQFGKAVWNLGKWWTGISGILYVVEFLAGLIHIYVPISLIFITLVSFAFGIFAISIGYVIYSSIQ